MTNKEELIKALDSDLNEALMELEAYEDCVVGVNKKSRAVAVASPMSFNKEFDTYPLAQFLKPDESGEDYDLDLVQVEMVAARYSD